MLSAFLAQRSKHRIPNTPQESRCEHHTSPQRGRHRFETPCSSDPFLEPEGLPCEGSLFAKPTTSWCGSRGWTSESLGPSARLIVARRESNVEMPDDVHIKGLRRASCDCHADRGPSKREQKRQHTCTSNKATKILQDSKISLRKGQ